MKVSNAQRHGIVAAGTFVIDRIATVENYPADDTYAAVLSETITNGGPAFNALVDWAHMKVPFPLYALGLVGNDADGQWVRSQLEHAGVDTALLGVHKKARTSVSTIVSATNSRTRTIFHHAGANAELGAIHFPFEKIKAKIFFLAFLALLHKLDRSAPKYGTVAAKLFSQAKAHGMKIAVTPAKACMHVAAQPIVVVPRKVLYRQIGGSPAVRFGVYRYITAILKSSMIQPRPPS